MSTNGGNAASFALALAISAQIVAPAPAAAEGADKGSVDVAVQLSYAIPTIDLDFKNYGGLGLNAGAGYAVVDDLLVGVRVRFDYLFLDTTLDLQTWIIDADAILGWFVWRGLQPYLGVGVTVVGDAFAGDVVHDPYFGAEVGLSYTFDVARNSRTDFGLEIGAEVAMMFDPRFHRTGTMAGTWNDGVFAYPLVFFGGRFSFAPGSADGEVNHEI